MTRPALCGCLSATARRSIVRTVSAETPKREPSRGRLAPPCSPGLENDAPAPRGAFFFFFFFSRRPSSLAPRRCASRARLSASSASSGVARGKPVVLVVVRSAPERLPRRARQAESVPQDERLAREKRRQSLLDILAHEVRVHDRPPDAVLRLALRRREDGAVEKRRAVGRVGKAVADSPSMLSGVAAHRSYSPTLSALVPSAAASSSTVASRPSVALMAPPRVPELRDVVPDVRG